MNARTVVLFIAASFLTACGLLVVDALRSRQSPDATPLTSKVQADAAEQTPVRSPAQEVQDAQEMPLPTQDQTLWPDVAAVSGPRQTVTLGAVYPDDIRRTQEPGRYKFKIELTTLGASIQAATLSEFDDRAPRDPRPLELLKPLHNGRSAYPLANTALRIAAGGADRFGPRAFPLDRLDWRLIDSYRRDTAVFEAELIDRETDVPTLRLTKTYRISPGSYDVVCSVVAENLTDTPLQVQMDFYGPAGMAREDAREDTRRIIAAHRQDDQIQTRLMTATDIRRAEQEKIRPPQGPLHDLRSLFSSPKPPHERLQMAVNGRQPALMWTAATNK